MVKICTIILACMVVVHNCAIAMIKPQLEVPTVTQVYFSLAQEEQEQAPVEVKAKAADMSVSEYKFFSAVVEAESDRKKGPIEGRVMIAIVILNRVDSKKFPNTITKVLK